MANFGEERPELSIVETDGITFVQVCENGHWVEEEDMKGNTVKSWTCDFNEFHGIAGKDFDLTDIKENPAKYIDFKVIDMSELEIEDEGNTYTEQIKQNAADIQYLAMMGGVDL